jgi:hypothetical protein
MSLDSAAYALTFISDGWTTARDIANMAFIFILIYLAMTVMFQAQTAGTMSTLAKVVVVALLINFSFFITRVVIDAGNILSIQFYNAIVADTPNTTYNATGSNNTDTGIAVPDLTSNIMHGINFTETFSPATFNEAGGGNPFTDFGIAFISFTFIYVALGAMLFILAAAFVAAGIKFIVRIVMLWFAIITAPLAFVAWSFQGGHGGGHGKNFFATWRDMLIRNAFFPAAFLFILLLISNFMGDNGNAGLNIGFVSEALKNGQTGGGLEKVGALIANMAVRLGFVVVMLYFAIKASDYIGVAGAGFAKTWGNKLTLGGFGGYLQGLRYASKPAAAPANWAVGSTALTVSAGLKAVPGIRSISKPLRENVLNPLADKSWAGEKSLNQVLKGNRAILKADELLKKDPKSLTDKEKQDLNHLSTEELARISPKKLVALAAAGALTDDKIKDIEHAKEFSDDTKHHARDAFETNKSEKIVETLKDIDSKLGGVMVGTEKLSDILNKNRVLDKKNCA